MLADTKAEITETPSGSDPDLIGRVEPDQVIYIPILPCYLPSSPEPYIPETLSSELTREAIVYESMGGNYDPPPLQILECNITKGTCRDVTAEIASEVADLTIEKRYQGERDLIAWFDRHDVDHYYREDQTEFRRESRFHKRRRSNG